MTVTNLFNNQVDALLKKVQRLARSNGADKQAYDAVRREVSGEYTRNGLLDVTSATLGELNDPHAEVMLNAIIMHCSETFYFEDRILKPVVVPVGVQLKTAKDGTFTLTEGGHNHLTELAWWLERSSGSKKVVFDQRIYKAESVYYQFPRDLCAFLLKLEAGEANPAGGPKPTQLVSKAAPHWEMVYLLGVEVIDLDRQGRLDEEATQRKAMAYRRNAEWAFEQHRQIMFSRGTVEAKAKCHGFYYRNQGVRVGEEQIRTYRLITALNTLDLGAGGVRLRYVHDAWKNQVRLHMQTERMTTEYQWRMMGEESVGAFQRPCGKPLPLCATMRCAMWPKLTCTTMKTLHNSAG
ncbi:MAG: hypothetical protein IPH37_14145 [Burkholderiales bacterium]|nr:hypothetical protein [Burkholderiales bacterium]